LLCCLIFVGFIVGWIGAAGYGILYGDVQLLITPWDADGNGCGYSKLTKDYPYLYFSTISMSSAQKLSTDPSISDATAALKYGTCVKECPKATGPVECFPPTFMKNKDKYSKCQYYPLGTEATPLRYGTDRLSRFCVPNSEALKQDALAAFKAEFNKYFGGMNIQKYVSDIISAKEVLLITLATGFVLGFVYMIVLRLFGGPMIYLSIFALLIGSICGGYMLFQKAG